MSPRRSPQGGVEGGVHLHVAVAINVHDDDHVKVNAAGAMCDSTSTRILIPVTPLATQVTALRLRRTEHTKELCVLRTACCLRALDEHLVLRH